MESKECTMTIDWKVPEKAVLSETHVDIWLIHIPDFVASVEEDLSLLDDYERQRAEAFRFLRDKESFVVAHAALRRILGNYLNLAPVAIRFQYNSFKKPHVANEGAAKVSFNLSHSQQYALVAVTLSHDLGVDIEYMKKSRDLSQIAERFFSEKEFEEYHSLASEQKLEGFYNAWTRKEAFIKAMGQGLFCSLKDFVVNLTPGVEAKIIDVKDPLAHLWHIQGFSPVENYCAAVVVCGAISKINFFQILPRVFPYQ